MSVKTVTIHSAGGVVMRESADNGEPEVLMIATHDATRWSLPKGRVEAGESLPEAARRETEEETGIVATVLAHLETIEYWYYARRGLRHHKFVDYFLMRATGGEITPQLSEIDKARWWSISDALKRATYENDRDVIRQGQEQWERYTNDG